jgi:4-hydroxy-2-oxoglutarate aldolase
MNQEFNGIIAPVATPFSEEGDLLPDALERNIGKYAKTPLTGILVGGSTGESPHLTYAEGIQIAETAAQAVPGDMKCLVGVASPTLKESLRFVEEISRFRVDALLVSVPSYYKNRMNEAALAKFFETLADQSPFPILLYNIPRFTGVDLSVDLVRRLAAHENVQGLKDSSADLIYMQKVLAATQDEEFQVLTGSAETLACSLVLGIRAAILAIACVIPEYVSEVMHSFEKRLPDLPAQQLRLCRVSWTIVRELGIQGVKHAMDLRGYEGHYCRLPLMPLTSEERLRAQQVLEGV